MTDLPRYRMVIDFGLEGFGDCVAPLLEADGDYVKWADISSRLQQLEQEKATLQKENSRKEAIRQCLDQDIHLLVGEKKLLVAALAETREALQQLRIDLSKIRKFKLVSYGLELCAADDLLAALKKNEAALARVDIPADSLSVVPQPPSEPSSTPSPLKVDEP